MAKAPIEKLRAICLALPEAEEKEAWGDPTFRVRDKIFAMEKRGDGRVSVWCKAPPGSQMVLVGADPARFFVPPYVGHKGWVGMRLDDGPDWDEVRDGRPPQLPPDRAQAARRDGRMTAQFSRAGEHHVARARPTSALTSSQSGPSSMRMPTQPLWPT